MKSRILATALILTATIAIGIGCHHDAPTSGSTTPVDTTKKDTTTKVTTTDSVLYSFAVFGCNRLDDADTNSSTDPSTANIAQLDRTFTDVMNLSPRPAYLFVVGDLVLGKTTDTSILGGQLRAWRQHYEASPIFSSGIKMVPVPGNHEFNDGTSSALCEQKWLQVMAPYIVGNNGPKTDFQDGLTTDQSQLTYSFNYQDSHFVLANSDPSGNGGTVPVSWLSSDFASARASGLIKHIFIFDHKPAYNWTNDGTSSLTSSCQTALWSAMQSNQVEAMISAHNHVYRRLQPAGTGTPWMLIPGNGGSSLDSDLPNDQNYGFTVVSIMKSGKVITKQYARSFGPAYNSPSSAATYPTTLRDSADITWN